MNFPSFPDAHSGISPSAPKGSRIHGAGEPTVDREHNQRGEPFLPPDPERHKREDNLMRGDPVFLSLPQRSVIEAVLPAICDRGGWGYLIAAAPPEPDNDHFHILLHADPPIHGKRIREWMKRWVTEELDRKWGRPCGDAWWADGGSTKPVKDVEYLNNCFAYIARQRTLPATDV